MATARSRWKRIKGDPMERLMLRPAEVAETIGISRSKTYELIQRGEIPSIRVGSSVRVPMDLLKAWINRQAGVAA